MSDPVLFHVHGNMCGVHSLPTNEPRVIIQGIIDEMQIQAEEFGLDRFGKFVIHNGSLGYRSYVVIDRMRFEFWAHDNVAKNKFKLKYPQVSDIEQLINDLALSVDIMDKDYPRVAKNIARISMNFLHTTREENIFYHVIEERFGTSLEDFK